MSARKPKFRAGLGLKLVAPSAAVTALVALVMVMLASSQVDKSLSSSFASKGEAIALSLSAAAEQSLFQSNSTALQSAIDSNKIIGGVGYIYVEDSNGTMLAHTFSPAFPKGLEQKNVLDMGNISSGHRVQVQRAVDLPWEGGRVRAIDVAAPIAGGALGTVHVGMDRGDIESHVRELQRTMAFWGSLVALLGIALGAAVAALVVIRPVRELTRVTRLIVQKGDLTLQVRKQGSDELGELGEAFEAMVKNLRDALDKLSVANRDLVSLTGELNGSASEQTRNATRQAAALQQTHTTAQEIQQTSRLAAEKAERVVQDAERADELGRQGEDAIQRTVSGLTAIRSEVAEIAGSIQALSDRTAQIAGITETVKDLADQSNMLALNAAIEAVRSGEHGKGFAVVAREIRSLADQSIASTRRVREVLDDIGAGIRRVASMSQAGAQKIEGGLEQVRASGSSLSQLSGIVRENSSSARQIAAAVSQQNAGIAQIFAAMGDLSKMMNDTMASIEATSGAASRLESVSSGAADAVKNYRLA
jgi:methyl-accepting chemotaxis protein